jgi:hypothetical protein
MKRPFDLTDKELVLLYLLLKERECPDERDKAALLARVEKILFEFMTIDEVEHIGDFYRSL